MALASRPGVHHLEAPWVCHLFTLRCQFLDVAAGHDRLDTLDIRMKARKCPAVRGDHPDPSVQGTCYAIVRSSAELDDRGHITCS
jgi:hypothetical protein